MTELHKVMKKYLEVNNCYPCNTFWEKQIREAIEADEKSSQLEPPVIVQKVKCQSCGKEFDELPLHTCPFAEEIHNDSEKMCNCCERCTHECAMDI